MKGIPSLTKQLYNAAKAIYGWECIAAEVGYKRQGEKGCWQAYVCILSDRSIFALGPTPQSAFDAALKALRLGSPDNLAEVLGCKLVA